MAIHTIDGSNPITSGLVLAIYDGQEVVNAGTMTQINASNSAFVGTAFVSNSTTDGGASVDISSIKASLEGQPNVTIFSRSAIDSYDAFGTITQIPWSLTAWADPYQSLGLVRNNTADSAILHFTIAGNVQTAVSAAGFFQADGTTHDYAATKNNTTDVKFYKDGSAHSTGTNANAGQNIQLNTSKAFVFSRNDTASAEGTDGTNEITLYWNRELSAAEHTSISTDPFQVFATTSRSITDIDGDNDVQAGQTNITVTTVGMDSSPTIKTATLGGESLTVVSAGETSWVVSVPTHIDLEWGATHELALTDDTGTVTLAGVTLSAPTGWETVAFTTAPNPATTESFYEYAQTDTGLGGAGYTMLAGDILAWETQTGLTIDGQTIPQVDPPSTVSGSYKIFKDATKTWTSVSTFTVNDLGFPGDPAPVLSSPTGTATGAATASGTVTTDNGTGTLYYYASTNSTETAATIKASGSSQVVGAVGSQGVGVTGLTPETLYYLHYVQDDDAAQESNVVSSSSFTTLATSDVPATSRTSIFHIANYLRSLGTYNSSQCNELVVEWLVSEGITRTQINQMLYGYLGGLGYTGSFNDRLKAWSEDV